MRAYIGRNTMNSSQNRPLVNSMGSSRLKVSNDSRWVISMEQSGITVILVADK